MSDCASATSTKGAHHGHPPKVVCSPRLQAARKAAREHANDAARGPVHQRRAAAAALRRPRRPHHLGHPQAIMYTGQEEWLSGLGNMVMIYG